MPITVINPKTGKPAHLVSTKGIQNEDLERLQLMIEDLLERAHVSGRNVWSRSDDSDLPVNVGAVWITNSQYELRFQPELARILEPAAIRKHVRRGTTAENPVIARPVTDFESALSEVFSRRAGDEKARSEIFFGTDDARFPSILITLAPQGDRIAAAQSAEDESEA